MFRNLNSLFILRSNFKNSIIFNLKLNQLTKNQHSLNSFNLIKLIIKQYSTLFQTKIFSLKMSSTPNQSNEQLTEKDDNPTSGQSNEQSSNEDNLNANKVACLDMCFFCFDMLRFHFNLNDEPIPKFTDECYPLFVTWYLGKSKELRGCIGNFSALNLNYGLMEYSIISATQDPRFSPITKEELSELHVSVSILLDFENASNYLDWEIGKHGIDIEFRNENGLKKSATFLPEVAVEQNWNKVQTIDCLVRKAGYKGVITEDLRKTIKLTRYQSENITASYEEYMKSKNIEI